MSRTAVILAGGLGTRLKPFTDIIPKPLLPIGEKAVLEIQIERLAKYGFSDIIVATNYKADYIEKFIGDGSRYGVSINVSREEKPLGTAGPLKLLENRLNELFVVINGDILSNINYNDLFAFAGSQSSMLTVGIKKILLPFAYGNIFFSGDIVTGIQEKPDIITHALAGIYVMKPCILNLIPADTYYGIDSLILNMLDKKLMISKYEIEEYWLDIGRYDDYEKAQKEFDLLGDD